MSRGSRFEFNVDEYKRLKSEGLTDKKIAKILGVEPSTILKWKRRVGI